MKILIPFLLLLVGVYGNIKYRNLGVIRSVFPDQRYAPYVARYLRSRYGLNVYAGRIPGHYYSRTTSSMGMLPGGSIGDLDGSLPLSMSMRGSSSRFGPLSGTTGPVTLPGSPDSPSDDSDSDGGMGSGFPGDGMDSGFPGDGMGAASSGFSRFSVRGMGSGSFGDRMGLGDNDFGVTSSNGMIFGGSRGGMNLYDYYSGRGSIGGSYLNDFGRMSLGGSSGGMDLSGPGSGFGAFSSMYSNGGPYGGDYGPTYSYSRGYSSSPIVTYSRGGSFGNSYFPSKSLFRSMGSSLRGSRAYT